MSMEKAIKKLIFMTRVGLIFVFLISIFLICVSYFSKNNLLFIWIILLQLVNYWSISSLEKALRILKWKLTLPEDKNMDFDNGI